jgi:hypothetical protein
MSALHGQRPAAFKPATARQTMDGTLLADAIKRRRKWPV